MGYTNKIENILVTKRSRELKLVSNDCINNVLQSLIRHKNNTTFLLLGY